jgi:hypothetical protein
MTIGSSWTELCIGKLCSCVAAQATALPSDNMSSLIVSVVDFCMHVWWVVRGHRY